jgi:hypothetical protein
MLLSTSKFFNPVNVLHNAVGLLMIVGMSGPKDAKLAPPKKKYRNKTVTKKLGREIESADYYKHTQTVITEFNKPSFANCMEWWDRTLCNKCTSNTS